MKNLTSYHKTPLDKLEGALEYLYDEEVGVINKITSVKTDETDPDFFHFAAEACNTSAFVREENFMDSGGAATNRQVALTKAVGEAVERYCGAIFYVEDFPLTSYNDATFPCVTPEAFNFFSEEQYNEPGFMWTPFTKDTPIRWVPGHNITEGGMVFLPAATVYIPYMYYQGTEDSPIVQPISTGLACHSSYEEAVSGGITEVVERDSFTIMWQSKMSPDQIRIETLSDDNFDKVQRFEKSGNKVTLFDITMDHGICCVLSCLQGSADTSAALVFAASCDLDPEVAVAKALEELAHTRRYSHQLKVRMEPLTPEFPNHENVDGQVGHLLFYTSYENAELCNYIFESKKRKDFSDLPNLATGNAKKDLDVLVERIKSVGENVYVCDVTTEDISSLGLYVVRAIIPGFQPLRMGFKMRSLSGNRLWTVPQKLGHKGVTREEGDNPLPHPYP